MARVLYRATRIFTRIHGYNYLILSHSMLGRYSRRRMLALRDEVTALKQELQKDLWSYSGYSQSKIALLSPRGLSGS
jgi:hypothetical protein